MPLLAVGFVSVLLLAYNNCWPTVPYIPTTALPPPTCSFSFCWDWHFRSGEMEFSGRRYCLCAFWTIAVYIFTPLLGWLCAHQLRAWAPPSCLGAWWSPPQLGLGQSLLIYQLLSPRVAVGLCPQQLLGSTCPSAAVCSRCFHCPCEPWGSGKGESYACSACICYVIVGN